MAFLTRRLAVMLAVLMALLAIPAHAAEELQLQEQEIKAGLLYNFLKYTEWPAGSLHDSITVCIFGDDPFGGYLQPMAGRTVNQRDIALRTVHDIKEAETCQLIFINAGEQSRWPELQQILAGKAILTVSDFPGFADSGGIIEFGLKNEHISAELNMEALTAAKLHVEDRLLKLVTIVHAPAEGER